MTLPKREAEAAALAAIPQDAVERAAHVLATNSNIKYREALTLARSMLYVSMLHSELVAERAKSDVLRAAVGEFLEAVDTGLEDHELEAFIDKMHAIFAALSSSPSPSPPLPVDTVRIAERLLAAIDKWVEDGPNAATVPDCVLMDAAEVERSALARLSQADTRQQD